ncbi:MAG: lysophospholipid acyltransferase family protein [Gammaproteobacteria bacterium]
MGTCRVPSLQSRPAADSALRLPRPRGLGWLAGAAERVSGLRELDGLYRRHAAGLPPGEFVRAALRTLRISYAVDGSAGTPVPPSGPLLIVANHPFGAADGLVLADWLLPRRPDLQLLANELLCRVPEMAPLIMPVDVFRRGASLPGLRRALRHLEQGGALVIFPAGEVSRVDFAGRCVSDPPWSETAALLARRSGARILPVCLRGHAAWWSLTAGAIHPRLRTALLARDLLHQRGSHVQLVPGQLIEPGELARLPEPAQTPYLRLLTYSLAEPEAAPPPRTLAPISPPVAPEALAAAVAALPPRRCLFVQGEFAVYLAPAQEMPLLLQEIARLRELSFRLVQEGSGLPADTDRFDAHYRHLFVWHRTRHEILGAYRLGFVAEILPRHGVEGLYTHTLFEFDRHLFARTGPAVEMGRSFVSPDWQRSFVALRLLWSGIASLLQARPEIRCLYGPVSISPGYSAAGRALIAEVLTRHHSDSHLRQQIRPRHPPRIATAGERRPVVAALADPQLLSRVIARIERGPGLPVLLRHYLELNGVFAGFNVDASFGGTLDGLVFVDVARIPARILARYGAASRRAAGADPASG